jgi:hypothetical protein
MSGAQNPPSIPDESAEGQRPDFETDRQAIKEDLLEEEALDRELQELEKEAEELEKARARRNASLERENHA